MQIHRSGHEGGVRLLRIERPPANAINGEFLRALHAEAAAADEDESVRAVVVTGTGRFPRNRSAKMRRQGYSCGM